MSAVALITTSSFGKADPAPKALLREAGIEFHENPYGRKLTEDEVRELLARHEPCGLIAGVEPLSARVLEGARAHLRVISRCGVGLESVDLAAAERLGMRVLSTPEAPAPSVAELALGLMLAVLRRIPEADRALRAGTWQALPGSLLEGKTVGVVGYGRVGRRVARLARAFGCPVLAYDVAPFKDPEVEASDLGSLLRRSDIVTLHAPLCEATRGLIGEQALASMKPGAVLINTSRGGLVDEGALFKALESGRLGGAGLDVFSQEPYHGPLARAPGVVLTAHMGSAAQECRLRMETESARNLVAGLRESGVLAS